VKGAPADKARAEDAEDRAAVDKQEVLGEQVALADRAAELAVLGGLLEVVAAECLGGVEG